MAVDKALRENKAVVSEAWIEELADELAREKLDRYVSLDDREDFVRRVLHVATVAAVLSEVTDR